MSAAFPCTRVNRQAGGGLAADRLARRAHGIGRKAGCIEAHATVGRRRHVNAFDTRLFSTAVLGSIVRADRAEDRSPPGG
jgi:hypothetical protein